VAKKKILRGTKGCQKIGRETHKMTFFKSAKNLRSENLFLKSEGVISNHALT
jgi:hypothetical protein